MIKLNIKGNIKNLIRKFTEDDVFALATQLSYSLLLAFFPFLIFVMTLIGYSPVESEDVLISFQRILPTDVFKLISNTVVEIVDTKNGNLLSFGLITTLWASSNGFKAMIKCLNKAYDEKENRSFLKIESTALLCTFGLAFIIIASVLLLVFGEINGRLLGAYLGFAEVFRRIWNILRYLIMLSTMIFIFAALYHYTPSRRLTWKEVIPGAIFTTLGWLLSSIIFSYYINNFGNYSKLYGSIGAVIVFMLWLFLVSLMLLTGGELNAVLVFGRNHNFKNI